jgi:Na+-translocating ferredoxin:NAD+ oxidoreductase RnfG subunit
MKNAFYTISFMILITVVFISALATVQEMSKDRMAMMSQMRDLRSQLYAFDLLPDSGKNGIPPAATTADLPWNNAQIMAWKSQFEDRWLPVPDSLRSDLAGSMLMVGDSVLIRVRVDSSNRPVAYGFLLKGRGLWGTITAFAAISADLKSMVGIDFTQQMETPGLGARITEEEFKYFFRNLDLTCFTRSNGPCVTMVRNKTGSNREVQTSELQAITGATLTCNGVLKMMNTDLRFYVKLLKNSINKNQESRTKNQESRIKNQEKDRTIERGEREEKK